VETEKLKIEYVKLSEIQPYKNNAKLHPKEQIEQIKKSIKEFGNIDPIGVWHGEIVEGHGRYIAAKQLKLDEVPIIRLDGLTDEERKAYALVHNKLTMNSDFDDDLLNIELDGIFDIDMAEFGFDLNFEDENEEPNEIEEDNVTEDVDSRCHIGDLWQLGNHRLICGDSTDIAVIDRLMDGVKAHLLLTDPPYGTTAVEWDCDIDLNKMWSVATSRSYDNAANVIFSAQPFTTTVINSNVKEFRYEIIWVKTQKTGFYNANRMPLKAHENILVFYRKLPSFHPQKIKVERDDIGRRRTKKADRCVLYGHVEAQDYVEDGTRYPSDVIEFSNWNGALFGNNENATVHPTQKPIELLSYLIRTYSNDSDVVLDLFGGSGSTLIACEQLNRKCYMCELDEHYCDVIINRWETLTGEQAVLLSDKEET